MLTYVINTSENKPFDTEKLFDLAGYNKIKWISCPLDKVKTCAESIYEKQNALGADKFRIAVIVDFYSFDRIRMPYGRLGFTEEVGVDMSLYIPYIEIYLLDNLIRYLENRDLSVSDFEVYYVQNEKSERYELLDSAFSQIKQILSGAGECVRTEKRTVEKRVVEFPPKEGLPPLNEYTQADIDREKRAKYVEETIEENYYNSFSLHCSKDVKLLFNLSEYPYGSFEMTFEQFWDAFRQRASIRTAIRRHYYITPYGAGVSRAAFETLSLSLYLIRLYEREEMLTGAGDMEVVHLDAEALSSVLEKAWCKINIAQNSVKKSNVSYYSLEQDYFKHTEENEENISMDEAIAREKRFLSDDVLNSKMSAEELYDEICSFMGRSSSDMKCRNRREFDSIMQGYLRKRDESREVGVTSDFNRMKNLDMLNTTDQAPSKKEYDYLLESKQKEISNVFERVLAAEYIEVDYSEEKEKADKAFLGYKKAKAWVKTNIIGDLVFLLLAVAAMMVPYVTLQLSTFQSTALGSTVLATFASGIFASLFVLSLVCCVLPMAKKMHSARNKLLRYYIECSAKERYSFSSVRRRYERDLLYIEQVRYEMRHLKYLYDANRVKDQNIDAHRAMLDEIEDCISAMLNHMDVEPTFDPTESVDGEFDVNKPIKAKENRIYQVFSIETIENMFPKKGRNEQ